MKVAYYAPNIPDVWSTDRYQHALAVTEYADRSMLIAHSELPDTLADMADDICVLSASNRFFRAREAADSIVDLLGRNATLLSAAHEYECVLAGTLAKAKGVRWVPDVFETPAMPRLNRPRSLHQLTTRLLPVLINQAEMGIHSFHPNTPYQYCRERAFIPNGAPVSQIEAQYNDRDGLKVVLIGDRPALERGGEYLLRAINQLENPSVTVDVCGNATEGMQDLSNKLGVSDRVHFHGWIAHRKALQYAKDADVGYAVLPPRPDFRFAPPIKVGEYLAAGTIPLLSDFPGSRYMAADSGTYVSPSVQSVVDALSLLLRSDSKELKRRSSISRERAEAISWESIRQRFVESVGI